MDKRITTLTIKGLNTSMPDLTVPDGACEKLMNMRFRDGSWRNVGAVQMTENIPLPADVVDRGEFFEFLGVHEVEGVNHYLGKGVIESEDDAGKVYDDLHLYAYVNGEWADLGMFASFYSNATSVTEAMSTDIRVTSFGNVLIVQCDSKLSYFIWSDGSYRLFTMPRPVSIEESCYPSDIMEPSYDYTDGTRFYWDLLDAESKEVILPTSDSQHRWAGELCYLVAYRMTDGTIVSPSNLRILCSEGAKEENIQETSIVRRVDGDKEYRSVQMLRSNGENVSSSSSRLRRFIPTISIDIPSDIDTSLINRVAIYSTRINSILDYEKILNAPAGRKLDFVGCYADNELPNQPFYLIEEIELAKLTNNNWTIRLDYIKLKDIVTRPQMYEPTQLHSISAEAIYDYNHRVHYGGITSTPYSHQPNFSFVTERIIQENASTVIERVFIDGVDTIALSQPLKEIGQTNEQATLHPIAPIISYPDYRASTLMIVWPWNSGNGMVGANPEWKFLLRPAVANNFAYFIFPPTEDGKYSTTPIGKDSSLDYSPALRMSTTFSEPNRIQVSAPNNPFSLPFQNSYAVGNEGSRVVAMNTVADSLVDSNFYGAYPLYIFTTDGIFALRAGSGEVLYAGTEIINHDKINNPRTIALNGSVVYACSEGLKALTGRQAVRISADIDPLTWAEAQFGINWEYGELLCRMANGEVFVWNIAAGAWSQRNDVVGSLRGGYAGEVTSKGMLVVCDINKEDIEETNVMLVTRPLKFDSVGFKKLDTLIARIASSLPCNWTIKVESSNDCREWRVIKNVVVEENLADVGIRRFSQSARFYRITISGAITGIVPITQIDIQLQDRYNNKLR